VARVWVASEAEAGSVAELFAAFRDWWGFEQPLGEDLERGVARVIGHPDSEFLLAATGPDAPAAGFCQLRYRFGVWHGVDDCWLEDLFVREEHSRRGLGSALVEATIERARARGCARIELAANEANPPAIALYQRFGFSAWHSPPDGRNLEMRLRL
jgi:ribosomal protein S18 acetylase RimI-like enzyme